jgi:predicted dehydrogenase
MSSSRVEQLHHSVSAARECGVVSIPQRRGSVGRRYGLRVTTFAMIGSGWRAQMFLKVARELGTFHCEGVVVPTPRRLDAPTFTSLDACLREGRPDFVLTATPRTVTPHVIAEAVDRGLPVLAETPPAPDLAGLRAL